MNLARTTLRPGDLVMWVEEDLEPSPLLVHEDGTSLLFQFGRKPWHEMELRHDTGAMGRGMVVAEAEDAIRLGVYPIGFPGRLYKCYDEETGQSFPDPRLEESL
jgi:hypothetical protein